MKRALSIALLLSAGMVYGQVADKNLNLITQPPNNASLFKFVETPVSYYNGTISSTIPIYEIDLGSLKLPIAINYHSGGIKVSEEASWVGLGWSLSASGVVSKSIVGTEDNYELGQYIDYMKYNIAPNRPLGRDGTPVNVIERGVCFPDVNGVVRNFMKPASSPFAFLPTANRQFDLFIYNFGSYSGKLINPKLNYYEDKFVSLDNNNIQFSLSEGSFESGTLKAIAPDGTEYQFNAIEHTVTYNHQGSPMHSYSRHLTSISTPEGRVINFTYKTVETILLPAASHSYSSYVVNTESPSGSGGQGSTSLAWNNSKTIAPTANTLALYLEQITWDNGKIVFNSDGGRADVSGGAKLNSIDVYNSSNVLIKKAQFSYGYFTGNHKYGDYFTQGYFQQPASGSQYGSVTEDARSKRLKLLSVKIDDMPPYAFGYTPGELPYKTAFAKDLWDYFNGVDFDQVTGNGFYASRYSLLPNPAYIGYYDASITPMVRALPGISFGQREVNEEAMKIGSLTQITYPTGGYTVFEYEANRFAPPDGVSSSVSFKGYSLARDGNVASDTKQVEFTVPTVNASSQYNNGKIDIRLSCGNCTTATNDNACYPYSQAIDNLQANGLYATLEIKNGGSWTTLKTWDFSDPDIVSHNGVYSVQTDFIQGSTYRITANYPDRVECPGDYYGTRVATIQAFYYDFVPAEPLCIGGGLRIKSVTDYTKSGQVALKRKFTYSDGLLLTKPSFLRIVTNAPFTFRAKGCLLSDPCGGCDESGSKDPVYAPGTTIPIDERFFSGYYSEPKVPYSYAANGSPVGYDMVTEMYAGQTENGKTEYIFNNKKDWVLTAEEARYFPAYKSNMNFDLSQTPGVPSIKNLLNGTLKSKSVYAKYPTRFKLLQKTLYDYSVENKKTWWGFKTEYSVTGSAATAIAASVSSSCNAYSMPSFDDCVELTGTTLYFYPVTSANVNLLKKTEQYEGENGLLEKTSDYVYNSRNQLQREITTDSKGHQISKETYFVPDRLSEDYVTAMEQRNMIDIPVEQIEKDLTQDKELSRSKTSFYNPNGSLILPATLKNSLNGVALETDVTYNRYDNKGNLLQYTAKDGVPTCYVWGYWQSEPVAKISGATYDQVLAALSQSDENLLYLQTLDGAVLESELNTLRNNLKISVPHAQVSTYLYKELVGFRQSTDPNGKKTSYEYDASNRLQLIKDNDGNVLQTFEYKYYGN